MDTTKGRITHDRELGEGEKETHIALMGVEREREGNTHNIEGSEGVGRDEETQNKERRGSGNSIFD